MTAVKERICDRRLLKLVRAMLRAGVMESGVVRHEVTGTPQGAVMSPLLANVYLHRLDRAWETSGRGVLVRYAGFVFLTGCADGRGEEQIEHCPAPAPADCYSDDVLIGLGTYRLPGSRYVFDVPAGRWVSVTDVNLAAIRARPTTPHVIATPVAYVYRWPTGLPPPRPSPSAPRGA